MKILSVDNIRKADAYTIENEPIASIDLMERAANGLLDWVTHRVNTDIKIIIFCGLGNNGGDGLALGRLLSEKDYSITIYIIRYSQNQSHDFTVNFNRLSNCDNIEVNEITNVNQLGDFTNDDVIVDALFGSGLTRKIDGFIGEIVSFINELDLIKISIDIPSGLFADTTSVSKHCKIIKADYTLSFQFPKLSFLLPENEVYVGNWEILDIGLSPKFINSVATTNYFLVREDIIPLLLGRAKFSHKGTFGHALIIAGSKGSMGAAVLSSKACLRVGAGLLTTHVPKCGVDILQTALPEAMVSIDNNDNYFTQAPDNGVFTAIGIGPGLGMEKQSATALKLLIQNTPSTLVIDADALNILSENLTWLAFLPMGSVLTPHPKEFMRIVGSWENDFERLEKQRRLAQKYNIYVVLKGANTSVCFPDGSCYFNSTGNPGMATAGSGDALTGIITGLIASGYTSGVAACLGVYVHGLAGDISAKKMGTQALMASDIINNLGEAFLEISS